MIRDHDGACFFGHLGAWLGCVRPLLLRDDRVVAQLLELFKLICPRRV